MQFFGARADDDPVALPHGQAEQFIANRAADEIDLHDADSVADAAVNASDMRPRATPISLLDTTTPELIAPLPRIDR